MLEYIMKLCVIVISFQKVNYFEAQQTLFLFVFAKKIDFSNLTMFKCDIIEGDKSERLSRN